MKIFSLSIFSTFIFQLIKDIPLSQTLEYNMKYKDQFLLEGLHCVSSESRSQFKIDSFLN